ncbi:integrase arm-type DNA-binding domain-containing protein [Novosphingobium sp. G106]|uniref:tyrosine-type recombinase/integrase n=1 Tax=Novosphingobium sp. G106 TaxID=2849500 RepID=UPI001C2D36C6|nr:integrase arm-type DNA-binding domain-containing protein [Novosphingobium sp. G106]MBV1688575.1 integrase arm-type DNA-binding domain-containing protein [Novosphingobium sp. G106]
MSQSSSITLSAIGQLLSGRLHDTHTPGLFLEATKGGKKVWKYRRRSAGNKAIITMRLGTFPTNSIADAREWARELNAQTEGGLDPREEQRELIRQQDMTVEIAHGLYLAAAREGRASRAKRPNKPRTIGDKLEIYTRDIAPMLGKCSVFDITENDLIRLVETKGKTAKIRANRLAAELKVFFGWASGLRGLEVGLQRDPAARLGDLRFPETSRDRILGLDELEWFLVAVAEEPRDFRRGMLAWLLTATRFNEVVRARTDEISDGTWTIPSDRSKNSKAHVIALGPWGQSLMASTGDWVFPAEKVNGPRKTGWYVARNRVHARMEALAGRPIARFTPHDLRRTARSNTKRLKVDFDTAEAMMNHQKTGLERIYDVYGLEEEKAAWFLLWEREIVRLAQKSGVAEKLEIPNLDLPAASTGQQSSWQAYLGHQATRITVSYSSRPVSARGRTSA